MQNLYEKHPRYSYNPINSTHLAALEKTNSRTQQELCLKYF